MVAVSLVVVGPARPRPTALLLPRSNGKPEAATAVYKLLMMGKMMPETCWAVFERRAINLRDWCIWLVDSLESLKASAEKSQILSCNIVAANEQCVLQQYREYIVVLLWQSFRYLLLCWQRPIYENNTNGTYFSVSIATVVMRTHHNVTSYVHSLPS